MKSPAQKVSITFNFTGLLGKLVVVLVKVGLVKVDCTAVLVVPGLPEKGDAFPFPPTKEVV